MGRKRPNVLTIAGFDPSAGAGVLADAKTFEILKCYGFSVITANTVQTEDRFERCYWVSGETIIEQLSIILETYHISVVKIGIIEDWQILHEVIDLVLSKNSDAKIIVDPILKASTGYDFHPKEQKEIWERLLPKVFLVTPNYNEIQELYPEISVDEASKYIATKTNVYLKGGHRTDFPGKDQLYTKEGKEFVLNPKKGEVFEKHGSGCVLSSAIAAHLALNFPLLKSCFRAKRYTEKVLRSNQTLLGYHGIP